MQLDVWDGGLISKTIIRRFIRGLWKVFGGCLVSCSKKDLYTEVSRCVFWLCILLVKFSFKFV